MIHDHACVGPEVTYSVVVAVALGLSVLTFGCALALYAADAVWRRLASVWRRAGEVQEARTVRL